jgi:hypothetical protein
MDNYLIIYGVNGFKLISLSLAVFFLSGLQTSDIQYIHIERDSL